MTNALITGEIGEYRLADSGMTWGRAAAGMDLTDVSLWVGYQQQSVETPLDGDPYGDPGIWRNPENISDNGSNFDTNSFFVGADRIVRDNLLIGAALQFSNKTSERLVTNSGPLLVNDGVEFNRRPLRRYRGSNFLQFDADGDTFLSYNEWLTLQAQDPAAAASIQRIGCATQAGAQGNPNRDLSIPVPNWVQDFENIDDNADCGFTRYRRLQEADDEMISGLIYGAFSIRERFLIEGSIGYGQGDLSRRETLDAVVVNQRHPSGFNGNAVNVNQADREVDQFFGSITANYVQPVGADMDFVFTSGVLFDRTELSSVEAVGSWIREGTLANGQSFSDFEIEDFVEPEIETSVGVWQNQATLARRFTPALTAYGRVSWQIYFDHDLDYDLRTRLLQSPPTIAFDDTVGSAAAGLNLRLNAALTLDASYYRTFANDTFEVDQFSVSLRNTF